MSTSSHNEKDASAFRAPSVNARSQQDVLIVGAQEGVKKVEALQRVWTPTLKVLLYIGIALARYV